MNLKEQVYSILIVSASPKFNDVLPDIFPLPIYSPMTVVSNISAAKRAVSERDFDFVVVNSPLPDDSGVRFAIDTVNSYNSVVLFIARTEQYEELYERLVEHGIFVMQKPFSLTVFQTAVGWLISARERLRKNEKRTLSIEEKMNEIRLVNRAKWLLIRELKMTEPEAHRYIEKQAMDRCIGKHRVAEEIIKTYG